MPNFRVSLYRHGCATVVAASEEEAVEKAKKLSLDEVCWEDENEEVEAFGSED